MDDVENNKFSDAVITAVMNEVEEKISRREAKRFRALYVLVGLVSFIGIGVITQLVDFYSEKAVDSKLVEVRQEFQSAKLFSQLLALATKLDLSDSFTQTDRDTVITLLKAAQKNNQLRSEPAFVSLLEKIIDSFSASNNQMHVSQIYDMYKDECLLTNGIAITLIQHYGREYLASDDLNSSVTEGNRERLSSLIEALDSQNQEGVSAAFYSLQQFKSNNREPDNNLRSSLLSYQEFSNKNKNAFFRVLEIMANAHLMSERPTPKIIRIAAVGRDFLSEYSSEIEAMKVIGEE